MQDVLTSETYSAITWQSGAVGGGADYVVQAVSDRLDLFILEYMRVNESECGGP